MTAEHSPATPFEIAHAKEAEERELIKRLSRERDIAQVDDDEVKARAKRIRPPTAEDIERLKARAVELGLLLPLSFVPSDARSEVSASSYPRK